MRDVVWWLVPEAGAGEAAVEDVFLRWTSARRIVRHIPRTQLRWPRRSLATMWTAPQYITVETAHVEKEERLRRVREARMAALQREKGQKREEIPRQERGHLGEGPGRCHRR
ncbi:hypothetical protein ABZ467_39445 [Streptomyces sp. NPDC005727]|uniref:hypothetical protein n=1 Tax=Streptomyces sp. NPDC005727 TaxID=3157053 RepID=UPI0033C2A388